MIKIGIQDDYYSYNLLKNILTSHYIPFIESADCMNIEDYQNNNIIIIYKISTLYIMKENVKNAVPFDVLLLTDNTFLQHQNLTSKVCICHTIFSDKVPAFNKMIFYGFDKKSHVTYSSIMEKGNLNNLVICIQNTFKTLYHSKMIKFEFALSTNSVDYYLIDSLLGIITLCLYLDLRFEKNEYINLEGETSYVK